jgi:hypothetical protein
MPESTIAADLARTLSLAVHRATPTRPGVAGAYLTRALRRASLDLALALDQEPPREDTGTSLARLWQLAELLDHAERRGCVERDEAVALLHLGSRLEVLLAATGAPGAALEQPGAPACVG